MRRGTVAVFNEDFNSRISVTCILDNISPYKHIPNNYILSF